MSKELPMTAALPTTLPCFNHYGEKKKKRKKRTLTPKEGRLAGIDHQQGIKSQQAKSGTHAYLFS